MSTQNMPVTPEVQPATDEQIGHILDMWKRRLKGRNFTNPEAQFIITNGGLYLSVMDQAADVLIDRVRSDISKTIVVYMDNIKRGRTVQQLLDATGRTQYVEKSSITTMPLIGSSGPRSGQFVWFKSDLGLSDAGVEEERIKRGLVRDLEMQLQYNAEHPEWADTHPNGDSWPADDEGNYDFVNLCRWYDGREVNVDRSLGFRWDAGLWFGGRSK